eukprot:5047712-Prymnesium_polylepis.1
MCPRSLEVAGEKPSSHTILLRPSAEVPALELRRNEAFVPARKGVFFVSMTVRLGAFRKCPQVLEHSPARSGYAW